MRSAASVSGGQSFERRDDTAFDPWGSSTARTVEPFETSGGVFEQEGVYVAVT